eukprot:Sdes_comp9366_c0_seq1m834
MPVLLRKKTAKKVAKSTKSCLSTRQKERRHNVEKYIRSTNIETVRSNLHVSHVPQTLPCREAEFSDIYQFLEGKLKQNAGGCMYICGMPGTGKTATTLEAIRCLRDQVEKREDLNDFHYVEINGMKLTEPRQAYSLFYKALFHENVTNSHAASLLEDHFTKNSLHGTSGKSTLKKKSQKPIILLLDELDVLV